MTLPFPHPPLAKTAWLAALLLTALPVHAYISEPETLIYGRILNRNGGQRDQLVTSGNLRWKIQKADGTEITFTAQVSELAGGASYLLRLPHQAMVFGQEQAARVLPLGITKSSASHVQITLDNRPARILSPGTSSLDLEETLRASAYRLDLEVTMPELDTDGDGMPDWYEDANGFDKLNAGDALLDRDHDGRNNLNEFKAGTDPDKDNSTPDLLTTEVIAYGASKSIVVLETSDSDSTPAQLIYTIGALPEGGRLFLRSPEVALAAGSTFTQADVSQGRLVFEHSDSTDPGVLEVSVRDENPEHAADTGSVRILLFNPPVDTVDHDGAEKLRFKALQLSRSGSALVADLSSTSGSHKLATPSTAISLTNYPAFAASFGADKTQVFLGGSAVDEFSGGYAADIISGGAGDDILAGGPGADSFVYSDIRDGNDSIKDFTPADHDIIDLSAVLNGTSTNLYDYVRIQTDGADAIIGISATGAATGYADLKIRLKNSALKQSDLADLYYAGNLVTGKAVLAPRISIIASATKASENGPVASQFTIVRDGSLLNAVTIQLAFSGTATNGTDYFVLSNTLVIPEGVASVALPVIPYVDYSFEGNEVVTVTIQPAAGYLLGTAAASLTIEDLKPKIWSEVVDSLASIDGLSPASITFHRELLDDRPVSISLEYSGTATKGTDYATPPTTLAFGAFEFEKTLLITPKSTASLATPEGETVLVSVKNSINYNSSSSPNRVIIVPEKLTFDKWQAAHSAVRGAGTGTIMSEDPGQFGMNLLMRYGFSLDAQNPWAAGGIERLPKVQFLDGYLAISFRRKPGITDLNYQVQYSNDLKTWKTGSDFVEDVSLQQSPNDPSEVVYRAKTPLAGAAAASMRVVLIPQ